MTLDLILVNLVQVLSKIPQLSEGTRSYTLKTNKSIPVMFAKKFLDVIQTFTVTRRLTLMRENSSAWNVKLIN